MPTTLSEFAAIPGMEGFFTATNGRLRCTAVRLSSGNLCLHSPVAGPGDRARDSLDRLGHVAYLLAPNHYHNKALAEYATHYPEASLVAPAASRPRLEKITGLAFDDLDAMSGKLPDGARLVRPAGLKTGEVWLVTATGWLVVDAFAGPSGDDPSPSLLGTFPKFGVRDKAQYADWVRDFITSDPPHTLVPCHGDIIHDPDLPAKLTDLVNRKLR
ncbi:MAG: hypothetical protein NXI27_27480 [Alphaproteobacteria bacterium]|nr:hypothetical protein [Alphaproteobacteria bacterium]